jgi:hypothetical protein
MVGKDSLKQHMNYYNDILKENICWLTTRSSQLQAVTKGYQRMLKRQKDMQEVIRWESRVEFRRYRIINSEITWRKKKFGSIPPNNLRVCSRERNTVVKYKKEYLKKLKEEQKKERDKAKKKKPTI